MNKKKKEKISYNPNAGNVPVNISKFNNSTFMGPDFSGNSFSSNSSGASVGEALDMLDKLDEENVNRTYTYEGPIFVDGYEDKHITMSTVAQSSRQALNNIKYRIADGDRYFMSRLSLSPDCLFEKGIKLPPKKIEKEVEKEPEAVQLSMFSMNEEFNKKEYLSDFVTDDIIVLLVDDIDKYDGQWVNKEFEKDFDDDELEEDLNTSASSEKFIVSKEDLQKVLKNISSSNDINILSSKKNNGFQKDINLSKEDQIKIIKTLSMEDYAYSTLSRNEIHKGSVLTIFFPKLELTINGQNIKGLTMYIKIDDSVAGKIVVVSLHSGRDIKEHPYKDKVNIDPDQISIFDDDYNTESLKEDYRNTDKYNELRTRAKQFMFDKKDIESKEGSWDYVDTIYDLQRDFYKKYKSLFDECKELLNDLHPTGYGRYDFFDMKLKEICQYVVNNFPHGWKPRNY